MKFDVEVLWCSKSGNPCCTKKVVVAETAGKAYKLAASKITKYARFLKLLGGNARQVLTKEKRGSHGKSKVGQRGHRQ